MNAAEIKQYVDGCCSESARMQVEEFDEHFSAIHDTDFELEKIMNNKKIRDKVGAFADVLWNDKGFLIDHLGDQLYSVDKKNLEVTANSLIKLAPHDLWKDIVKTVKGELDAR